MWKDIKGFENYKINEDGVVVSKKTTRTYEQKRKDGSIKTVIRVHQERTLKTWSKMGYPTVQLCAPDGRRRKVCVHTLVAETFLGKPSWAECVNHKDGNKLNNNVSNLEWCTYSENNQHAYDNGLTHAPQLSPERAKKMRAKVDIAWHHRKVIDLTTGKRYESIKATKQDGFSPNHVQRVCAGTAKSHRGHIFAYDE